MMGTGFDKASFDRLVLDHLPRMHRLAVRLTGDVDAAEDVVQEAMVRALRSRRTFAARSRFSTWITRIVINAFRDWISKRPSMEGLCEDMPDSAAASPPVGAEHHELGEVVARMVSSLPPRQREVLVLIVYEQLTSAEAAAALGISQQSVRTNLHHARRRLKRQLRPYLPEEQR